MLYVGRLSEEKGVSRLLRAFGIAIKKVPGITLTIVGDGELDSDLKKMAHQLNLGKGIKFIGSKTLSEISNLLDEFEVFVLPSYQENCPVYLLEAQVKGVPCLVTKNGASEKVLLYSNGLTVDDDGSGEQLAHGILQMLNQMEVNDRMKIRKREKAAFSPQVFTENMYAVLKEVMN